MDPIGYAFFPQSISSQPSPPGCHGNVWAPWHQTLWKTGGFPPLGWIFPWWNPCAPCEKTVSWFWNSLFGKMNVWIFCQISHLGSLDQTLMILMCVCQHIMHMCISQFRVFSGMCVLVNFVLNHHGCDWPAGFWCKQKLVPEGTTPFVSIVHCWTCWNLFLEDRAPGRNVSG